MSHATRSLVTMVLGFLAFIFFVAQPDHAHRRIATDDAPPAVTEGQKVVLTRASDGHFYTDAQVNGRTIHFLVDTGATTVALSKEDADLAGISTAGLASGTAQAASGRVRITPVTFDKVGIGNIEETAVDGVVMDGEMGISLLGQSWLKRINSVTIADDRMTLE